MSEDLIRRSDAIDILYREKRNALMQDHNSVARGIQASINCISNIPTIESKRGEWIETSDGTMCGNCHKFPYDDGEYHIANWYSDFCPNCGASMTEREGE